jgi:ATP-dependent Lhr-like helicase
VPPPADPVLARFSSLTRDWFAAAFAAPTPAQAGAWEAIAAGDDTLVVAPTGSGKTLAAFLWALDSLHATPSPDDPRLRCRVLYVSPLKALAVDVERNLRAPLAGLRQAARRAGQPEPSVTVGVRSGDTPADERRRFGRTPPDVLITTPESLFLLLTSQAREALRGVRTVIVDEIHAVAGTKRGAHLALSLERLDALLPQRAQRIGLSATVRPIDEVARFLGGTPSSVRAAPRVVAPPSEKRFDLRVVVPVEDMTELGAPTGEVDGSAAGAEPRASIWPHVEEHVLDLVEQHRSTLVFANSRRLAERLTARLNEIADQRAGGDEADSDGAPPAQVMAQSGTSSGLPPVVARAHHGSVSKQQRALIEDDLKSGRLPAVVATSSLELGIDMGAVDLVVQVESPPSVASGLQRVGRAGHQVGAVSRGVLFPKFRGDLVQTAVVVDRMRAGQIEALRLPRNPLDVLAQQVVAMVALDDWPVDALLALVRRAAPFATLPASAYEAVLDMLAGRYPSDEFAELRPRLVWDRVAGTLSGRPGAQRLAVTSGGTIPDRGLFGVFLVGGADGAGGGRDGRAGARVGELDEEMVYESRVGDVFALGASSWRIEDITHDRVLVSPAPGRPGRLPFWKGDVLGRPAELGRAVGAFVRELARADDDAARARLAGSGLDPWAVDNLLGYLREQRDATRHLPDDRTVVVERFRDELGDWRLVVHSPYGSPVHAPWALAVGARLRERYGVEAQAMHADDGMVFRIPDTDAEPPGADLVLLDPDDVESLVTDVTGGSALFAARFRECAARALLLPRRDPGRRSPLWQQRQRSAALLQVAARYASFPVVLETMREVLQDVYDLPALVSLLRDVTGRRVSVVEVETPQPSPFARSLLFGYVASFLYEGDAPLAERRAAALSLDPALLAELLGRAELSELLDPGVVAATEAELQRTAPDRRARDAEAVADLLRLLGPLSDAELADRCADPGAAAGWVRALAESRRAIQVRIAGEQRWAAVEDAGRLRDALGVPLPVGVPEAFTEPVPAPLLDLVARHARTHGPFAAADVAARFGIGVAVAVDALRRLAADGRVVEGDLAPGDRSGGGAPQWWCDASVLRLLRRRCLAALRHEVEPVEPAALARFLPSWQHVGGRLRGVDGVLRVVEQLAGCLLPASALERLVLPARVAGYLPAWLDELTAAGEVAWSGHGTLPGADGWVALHPADAAPLTLPTLLPEDDELLAQPLHRSVLDLLDGGGAYFFRTIADGVAATDDEALVQALWDLVWAGRVTNDTLAPLRTLVGGRGAHRSRPAPGRTRYGRPARPRLPSRTGPPLGAGRWSLLPDRDPDPTRRAHATAELLLDRYGVVTRGSVAAEGVPGGFAAVYRVLTAFEESGRCRRGYFVAGLGAAQFASSGAVDRLRAPERSPEPVPLPAPPSAVDRPAGAEPAPALVLAATDPANPYGAALPWPERPEAAGHRPGRKAGSLVVLVTGDLVLYVERGGRTLLSFTDDPARLRPAADALALAVRDGALGRLAVERADGSDVVHTDLGRVLADAGFHVTPRGLRLRAWGVGSQRPDERSDGSARRGLEHSTSERVVPAVDVDQRAGVRVAGVDGGDAADDHGVVSGVDLLPRHQLQRAHAAAHQQHAGGRAALGRPRAEVVHVTRVVVAGGVPGQRLHPVREERQRPALGGEQGVVDETAAADADEHQRGVQRHRGDGGDGDPAVAPDDVQRGEQADATGQARHHVAVGVLIRRRHGGRLVPRALRAPVRHGPSLSATGLRSSCGSAGAGRRVPPTPARSLGTAAQPAAAARMTPCPRATPCGWRPAGSTPRWRGRCCWAATSGCRRSPRSTWRAHAWTRSCPAASTCCSGSTAAAPCTRTSGWTGPGTSTGPRPAGAAAPPTRCGWCCARRAGWPSATGCPWSSCWPPRTRPTPWATSAPTCSRPRPISTRRCAGSGSTRIARSARPCSTSARSPGSAPCTGPRACSSSA